MQHALSTFGLANTRLTTVWLERIQAAHLPLVEFFCARQHLDYRDRAQINELGHWFRDSELKLHSVQAPLFSDDVWGRSGPNAVINLTEPVKSKRLAMTDEIKRALEIAEVIPFRYLIQRLGVAGEEYDERKVDSAFTALEEISLFAKQRGVEVLLENGPNRLSTPERLLHFNEATHLNLNFCFDVGSANLTPEGVEGGFRLMKTGIRSTQLSDNNGREDQHLLPLWPAGGTVNWRRMMHLFRGAEGAFPLVMEPRDLGDPANTLQQVRKTFDQLEEMRPLEEEHF
jgi:sugar phosphate isomerase/epimerase